jgi:hypothetical protein
MPLQEIHTLIENKYPNLTEFIKFQRAVSLPETETTESKIRVLAKKKLKEESCNLERDIKYFIFRYNMPKQYKEANFKKYL